MLLFRQFSLTNQNMLNKLRILKNLDLFAVPYKTKISQTEDEQKSLGGMIIAILYGVLLAYFIYVLIHKQEIYYLPQQNKAQLYASYNIAIGDLIQLSYGDNLQKMLILSIHKIQYSYLWAINQSMESQLINQILFPSLIRLVSITHCCYLQIILRFNKMHMILIKMIKFQIYNWKSFFRCKNNYSQDHEMCIYSHQAKYALLKDWQSHFGIVEGIMQVYPSNQDDIIFFPIQNQTNTNGQFIFKPVNLNIDDGIICFIINKNFNFQQILKQLQVRLINSFYSIVQVMIHIYHFFMRLDPKALDNREFYPKFSQILAEVGSISSSLLMIRVIIILINQDLLEERLVVRQIQIDNNLVNKDIYKFQQFIEANFGKSAIENSSSLFIESESKLTVKITHVRFRQASNG
ncbi:hypothetical protein pb186bvf_014460 [Paramecium bursaria]